MPIQSEDLIFKLSDRQAHPELKAIMRNPASAGWIKQASQIRLIYMNNNDFRDQSWKTNARIIINTSPGRGDVSSGECLGPYIFIESQEEILVRPLADLIGATVAPRLEVGDDATPRRPGGRS